MDRAATCKQIREGVQRAFPRAAVTTNDGLNPATPIAVTAEWRQPQLRKTVRAQSIIINDPVQFIADAVRQLTAFYSLHAGGLAG